MQSYHYPQFPESSSVVHVALYTSLENAAQLKKRIIAASTAEGVAGEQEREAVNFAFINASLITSTLHLQTAVYQAILAQAQGTLRTKTVHSEVLWILNPTNNISEAIRRYGVSDSCTAAFVVRIGGPEVSEQEIQAKMDGAVHGKLIPVSGLESLTDWSTIKKHYKLNTEVAILGAKGDVAQEHNIIDHIIVSTVAMKSVSA